MYAKHSVVLGKYHELVLAPDGYDPYFGAYVAVMYYENTDDGFFVPNEPKIRMDLSIRGQTGGVMMTKDELIAKLVTGLIDVLETDSPRDIVHKTGCDNERAEEIFGLVRACLTITDYRGIVDIDGLIGLLSEAQ